MPDLYRVTVVAASDRPLEDSEVDAWAGRLTAALEGVVALPVEDAVIVRSDRQGFDVVLLLEAESADDARERAEEGALTGMAEAQLEGTHVDGTHVEGDKPGRGSHADIHLELVRAEPAYEA